MSGRPPEFSLIPGGPLFKLYLITGLSDAGLGRLGRRILVLSFAAWLPGLLLSWASGTALGGVAVPFLYDVGTHVRWLVSLPLLLIAEVVVHRRLRTTIDEFAESGIVPPDAFSGFSEAIASTARWRDAGAAEAGLLALVLAVGHYTWATTTAVKVATWYAEPAGFGIRLTPAGMWNVRICLPFFQFLMVRWLYRCALWARFLLQVSRLPLRLVPTHPDGAGGLGFLSLGAISFAPLTAAASALLSGIIARKILFDGAALASFKFQIAAVVLLMLVVVLGPLCALSPLLWRVMIRGVLDYGTVAAWYVERFDRKWNRKGEVPAESFLGTPDIQSLADIANAYAVVRRMRPVPFDRWTVASLALAALVPFAPLAFSLIPLDRAVAGALRLLFG